MKLRIFLKQLGIQLSVSAVGIFFPCVTGTVLALCPPRETPQNLAPKTVLTSIRGEPIPVRYLFEFLGIRPGERRFLLPFQELESLREKGFESERVVGMHIVNDYGTNLAAVIRTRKIIDHLGASGLYVSRDPEVRDGFASLHDLLDGLFRISPTRSASLFLAGGRYSLCISEAFEMAVRKAIRRRAGLHVIMPEFAIQGKRDLDAFLRFLERTRVPFRLCLDDAVIDSRKGMPRERTLVHANLYTNENTYRTFYPLHREHFYSRRAEGEAPYIPEMLRTDFMSRSALETARSS